MQIAPLQTIPKHKTAADAHRELERTERVIEDILRDIESIKDKRGPLVTEGSIRKAQRTIEECHQNLDAVVSAAGDDVQAFRRRLTAFCVKVEGQLGDALSDLQASRRADASAANSSMRMPSATPQGRYRGAQPRSAQSDLSASRVQVNTPRRRWNGGLIGQVLLLFCLCIADTMPP